MPLRAGVRGAGFPSLWEAALIGAMLAIIGCAPAPTMFDDNPRQWGAAHQERFQAIENVNQNGSLVHKILRHNANIWAGAP